MNAASLAEQIDALRLRYGMDVEGVTPELLREDGVADVDYLQAVNVLGAVDIARAVMAKSPEELFAKRLFFTMIDYYERITKGKENG